MICIKHRIYAVFESEKYGCDSIRESPSSKLNGVDIVNKSILHMQENLRTCMRICPYCFKLLDNFNHSRFIHLIVAIGPQLEPGFHLCVQNSM